MLAQLVFVAAVAYAAGLGHKHAPGYVDFSWEENYKEWRQRDTVSLAEWRAAWPKVVPAIAVSKWEGMDLAARKLDFKQCITDEATKISKRVAKYKSPALQEVQDVGLLRCLVGCWLELTVLSPQAVKQLLNTKSLKVSVAVFWGRGRYVKILWPYIERNLAANMGIVGEVLLITHNRDFPEGKHEARDILDSGVARYPGVVKEVPFCSQPYGCAFDKIMNQTDRVYIKLDDDIIFIKDGSFEHLVYQVLTNKDYTFFSGSVVNNPHSYAVHKFVGAYVPTSFHIRNTGQANSAPLFNYTKAVDLYW